VTDDRDKSNRAPHHSEEGLFDRVSEILDAARTLVSRTVNITMVQAYWLIGRNIVEVEQGGEARAGYGEEVVKRLASRMTARYGPGFTATSIKRMRQFYQTFPNGSRLPEATMDGDIGAAVRHHLDQGGLSAAARHLSPTNRLFPPQLSWTHYRLLLTIRDEAARAFYEIEAAREGWTTRDLQRQVASLLYERLAKSRDKEGVLALAREGQQITTPANNVRIESFHGRFPDELLDRSLFSSVVHAQSLLDAFTIYYIRGRSYSSLKYLTPADFAAQSVVYSQLALVS
jgi:transposase InsO family protein